MIYIYIYIFECVYLCVCVFFNSHKNVPEKTMTQLLLLRLT